MSSSNRNPCVSRGDEATRSPLPVVAERRRQSAARQALLCWAASLLAGAVLVSTSAGQSSRPYAIYADERLAGYLAEALDHHPAVAESFARYRAALQRIPQVTALPDPVLNFNQYVRSIETRVGPQTTGLSISQRFPWFGKLEEKGKVAAKEAEGKRAAHEIQKTEIIRQVKLAYFELGHIDRAITITEEERLLLEHFETLARARYSQGIGLQQAVVRLQAELTRIRSRLETLRRRRTDAQVALNTLRDLPPESGIPTVELPSASAGPLDLQDLYEKGRQSRPELEAAFLEIEKNEKRIHATRKEFWPDITVGAGFINVPGRTDPAGRLMPPADNGKNVYNVTVGINLPIRRRKYNAGVLEATENFLAARQSYRHTVNAVEAAIRSVAFELEALEEQIALYETALLPQAEQSLQSSESAYASGELGVLELLDSERTLLEVRLGLARHRSDYMKALAEMERAIGSAFPEETP